MNTLYYDKYTIPPEMINHGINFIRKIFLEVWGINRTDINYNSINTRKNLILFDDDNIVGWLGIEKDGELTNACIENRSHRGKLLLGLIEYAYRTLPEYSFYAKVPISKISSGNIFIRSGMRLESPSHLSSISYPEKTISLVRLVLDNP